MLLGISEDDVLQAATTDRRVLAHRAHGGHVTLVSPGWFGRLVDSEPYDDLIITARFVAHPDLKRRDAWIAACRTRVRIPTQR